MVNSRGRVHTGNVSKDFQRHRDGARHSQKRASHRVKLRGAVGAVGKKHSLCLGLLNVDGFSPSTLEDVQ